MLSSTGLSHRQDRRRLPPMCQYAFMALSHPLPSVLDPEMTASEEGPVLVRRASDYCESSGVGFLQESVRGYEVVEHPDSRRVNPLLAVILERERVFCFSVGRSEFDAKATRYTAPCVHGVAGRRSLYPDLCDSSPRRSFNPLRHLGISLRHNSRLLAFSTSRAGRAERNGSRGLSYDGLLLEAAAIASPASCAPAVAQLQTFAQTTGPLD